MIDIHCHLTSDRFEHDRDEAIEQASQRLEAVIISATHPNEAEKALKLCEKYSSFLYATLGLHPVYAAKTSDKELEDYLNFIKRHRAKLVGVGEIGLDYHWVRDIQKIERMKEMFVEFLRLARELDLPAVLHLRNALDEGLSTVTHHRMTKVVFHCFSGTRQQAEEVCRNGYYISVATNILRSKNITKAVSKVPLNQVVTETDSPYLGPGRRRNMPQNVGLVIDKLAELWGLSSAEADDITSRNARKLFGISN
jgi:TatD DNase family protein